MRDTLGCARYLAPTHRIDLEVHEKVLYSSMQGGRSSRAAHLSWARLPCGADRSEDSQAHSRLISRREKRVLFFTRYPGVRNVFLPALEAAGA